MFATTNQSRLNQNYIHLLDHLQKKRNIKKHSFKAILPIEADLYNCEIKRKIKLLWDCPTCNKITTISLRKHFIGQYEKPTCCARCKLAMYTCITRDDQKPN